MTIVVLYAIGPMLETLGRLGTWIDNLPGVREFLNPRCGQPICIGDQAPIVDFIIVVALVVTVLTWLAIAKARGWFGRRPHPSLGPRSSRTVVASAAVQRAPEALDDSHRVATPSTKFDGTSAPDTAIADDGAGGSLYREVRSIRLSEGRFVLQLLSFDTTRTVALRQLPECSYDAVDRTLYLPTNRGAVEALVAFSGDVDVLWSTEAWRKASELGA